MPHPTPIKNAPLGCQMQCTIDSTSVLVPGEISFSIDLFSLLHEIFRSRKQFFFLNIEM